MRLASYSGHLLFTPPLGPSSVVVDCGAHRGWFTRSVAERHHCEVFSIEASPELFAALPAVERTRAYHFAVCGRSGEVTFHLSSAPLASTILDKPANQTIVREVAVPAIDFAGISALVGGRPIDVLKLDIEGAEIEFLDAASDEELRSVGQFTIEFHDTIQFTPRAEVDRVCRRLTGLGFRLLWESWRLNTTDLLFVHPRLMSRAEHLWLMGPSRLGRGIARRAGRMIRGGREGAR